MLSERIRNLRIDIVWCLAALGAGALLLIGFSESIQLRIFPQANLALRMIAAGSSLLADDQTAEDAGSITYGQAVTGMIATAGQVVTYTFPAEAGDTVWVRLSDNDYYFDPEIRVSTLDGDPIAGAWSSGDFVEITQTLSTAADYVIWVGDNGGTDTAANYVLFLQRRNDPAGAVAIGHGETRTESIGLRAELDTYTFTADAGDMIWVRLSDNDYYFDPEIRLSTLDGDLIADAWSSGDFVEIVQMLTTAGDYVIWVGDNGGTDTAANYALSLYRRNDPAGAVAIGYGETRTGSIGLRAELDTYTFPAEAGDTVWVRLSDNDYYFDPEIRLSTLDGDLIADAWSSGDFVEIAQMLTTAGDYVIWVGDNGGTDTAANYALSLYRRNDPAGAVAIGYGETRTGSIGLRTELDTYTFTADAGDTVWVRLSDSDYYFDPQIHLSTLDGALIADAWSSGDFVEITRTLTTAGDYVIWVGDNGGTDTAANYALSLYRRNDPAGAVAIGYGETRTGSIGLRTELDTYTFTADAGDMVWVRLSDSDYYFDPEVRLSTLDGDLIADAWSSGDFVEITRTLTTAGDYVIWVGDNGGTDTAANYALSLYRRNDPAGAVAIGYGETRTGSIGLRTELDTYTFTADAGDTAWVRLSDNDYYFDPQIHLSTLDGSLVASAWSAEDLVEIRQTLPVTDTYAVWVGDSGGTDTANYALSLLSEGTELVLPIGETQEILVFPESPLLYRVDVPDGTSNLFITLQKYDPWSGSVALYDGGNVVASTSGSSDLILQLPSPAAGSHSLTVTGSGRARLTAYVVLPELALGQWRVGTILDSWGSAWYQYTVPVGQGSLFINVETIGLWSQLKVYYGALGATPFWSASGSTMELEIPSPVPGVYYVHLSDSAWIQGEDQARDHLIRADVTPTAPPACIEPSITSFTPTTCGTTGTVTVQITGQCLDSLATVFLARDGFDNVAANLVVGSEDGHTLSATFEFSTTEPGEWALWVMNPDSQSTTAPTPLTVQSGGESELWVEILGRQTIRAGRQQTFYVRFGNTGDIDAIGVPLWIDGIPTDATWELGTEIKPPPQPIEGNPVDWDQVPMHVETGNQVLIPLLIPTIPPGYAGEIPIKITIPSNQRMQLRARLNPVSLLCSPDSPGEKCISALINRAIGVLPGASCFVDAGCWFYNYAIPGSASGDIHSMFADLVGAIVTCAGDLSPWVNIINAVRDAFAMADTVMDCSEAVIDAVLDVTAVTSISPEDKFGPAGWDIPNLAASDMQRWIDANRALPYRVDFWNKEDAPAATVDVIITDTLDVDLDWATFEFAEIGFLDWQVQLEPTQYFNIDVENVRIDLSQYYPAGPAVTMTVNVEGTFDPTTGQIRWEFHALEPGTFEPPEEPLAGFLPPITDSGWEIGWVDFTASPKPGLASGTVISNRSFVKFDLNPSNPAPPGGPFINTLDAAPPTSAVHSPTGDQVCSNFRVSWAGQDDSGGSGLEDFDVFVDDLEDADPAYLWQSGIASTSALFSGRPYHRYGFYTRARDHVGNLEPSPAPLSYDVEVTAGWYCSWLPLVVR